MIKRVLVSLLLGYVTCELIAAIKYLPHSETRDAISDALSYPGGLFSAPFFPQGIHSATGAEYWPIVALLGNLLFYAALWFGMLSFLRRRRERKERA
jgi:hypothetical protein